MKLEIWFCRKVKEDYLVLVVTAVDIVDGVAILFEKGPSGTGGE